MKKKRPPLKSSARRLSPPRLSASLLASAVAAQGEGILLTGLEWNRDGLRILFANAMFQTMTGFSAAKLIKRGHGFLHVDKALLGRIRTWHKTLQPGQALTGEGYLHRHDGTTWYAAWSFSPVTNARGRITHIVASYRDMTEKRRLQEELVHSQRLDAVGRLAGGVAHDFNNLLSVINGYCEIISGKVANNTELSREIREIHLAGEKAAGLVRQLLAFSRRQSLDPKIVNLDQLLRANADILKKLLKPDFSIVLDLQAGAGNIRIDPAQLQQVILNLTLNARDALGIGGRVTLTTARREIKFARNRRISDMAPGHYVMLSVSDNGSGMDEETQSHLFEPFYTTKEEGKGTGLGLALVYGVVQQSGGHIYVKSSIGVGSTFEIFLPEVKAPADSLENTLQPLPATHGHETILLVEEDGVVRKMLAGILTADGYRVLAATSPAIGLSTARRLHKPIDLLIADPGLPGGSDSERLARALYAAQPALRVLLTGSRPVSAFAWLDARAQAQLAKPFALSALLRAARDLLDGRNSVTLSTRPSV